MGIQCVELLFRCTPSWEYASVKKRAETILGEEIDTSSPSKPGDVFILFHKKNPVTYAEGTLPAQTVIMSASAPIEIHRYEDDIQQSWNCPYAAALLEGTEHTLLVTEMMARGLDAPDRVRLFHGVLQAVIEQTAPNTLVFKHSQQVLDPAAYLGALGDSPIQRPGTLNVRFFKISNSDGDMLMDTRGLDEIGLPDLQCHYRNLDPQSVARLLFNTALYLFEQGAVIESGHTIAGINPNSKWTCQYEDSLVEPKRVVLNLNPGPGFAAGLD